MANDFLGPWSPEDYLRAQSYYGGPAVNVSPAAAPAPAPSPAAFYGPPAPPPGGVEALPPSLAASLTGALGAPPPPKSPAVVPQEYDPAKHGPITTAVPSGITPIAPITIQGTPTLPEVTVTGDPKRATKPSTPRPAGGGGGAPAAKPNPDPYGQKEAMSKLLGTYDAEADAVTRRGAAEQDRAFLRGESMRDLARMQEEDAAIARAEADEHEREFSQMMAKAREQMDTVRNEKIDPDRFMNQDGMGFRAILGGLFGGIYMGLNKLDHNPFIDDLNRQIDRDIAVQEKNLANKRQGVQDSMNMLGMLRQQYKDEQLAKLQARNLAYEAAKVQIDARGIEGEGAIAKANAEQARAGIERQQAALQKEIADRMAMQAASVASARGNQMRALQADMRNAYKDIYDKGLAAGLPPDRAEFEANRQVSIMFGGGADPRGPQAQNADPLANVPKQYQNEAAKELREQADREQAKKALANVFTKFANSNVTDMKARDALKAEARAIIKPHMKGANSDKDLDALIEPFVPSGGLTTQAAQNAARDAGKRLLDNTGTTPLLDRYAPGWRPQGVQLRNEDGTPK